MLPLPAGRLERLVPSRRGGRARRRRVHGGRLFAENVRGHLRFLAKHRGAREAERARRLLLAGVRLRLLLFRGERRNGYREAARWLSSGNAASLLRSR